MLISVARRAIALGILLMLGACSSTAAPSGTPVAASTPPGEQVSATSSVPPSLRDAARVWCDQNRARVASAAASLGLLAAPFDSGEIEAIGVWAEAFGPDLPNLDEDLRRVLDRDELEAKLQTWAEGAPSDHVRACEAAFEART